MAGLAPRLPLPRRDGELLVQLEPALRARLDVDLLEQRAELRLGEPEALEQEVGEAGDRDLLGDLRRAVAAREDRLAQPLAQPRLALLRRRDLVEGLDRDAPVETVARDLADPHARQAEEPDEEA